MTIIQSIDRVEIHASSVKADSKWLRKYGPKVLEVGGSYTQITGYSPKRFVTIPGNAPTVIDDVIQSVIEPGRKVLVIARDIITGYGSAEYVPFREDAVSVYVSGKLIERPVSFILMQCEWRILRDVEAAKLLLLDDPEYLRRAKEHKRNTLLRAELSLVKQIEQANMKLNEVRAELNDVLKELA